MSEEHRFQIVLSKTAYKYYKRLDRKMASRLDRAFEALEMDPFGTGDIKPIQGEEGKFRLRIGGLRIIYEIDFIKSQVNIFAILPRGQAYK